MVILVLYDIVETKQRNKVIKICEAEGLVRVQKSVFLGEVERGYLEILKRKLYFSVNQAVDSLFIFPMTKEQVKEAALFGVSHVGQIIDSWEESYMVI